MHRRTLCAMALAVAWSAPFSARAQDAELAQIREEIRQMKQAYEQRIEALEKRLEETEAKAGKAADSAAQAQSTAVTATQAAVRASSRPAAENALNPGISAILNGVYSNLKQDPSAYRINGFVPTMGDVSPGRRGLSLGESELGFTSNIDQMFRGSLIASISPDNSSIDVEEGFIQTLGLSNGFTVKAGRFFSAVGYQNQIHAHAWDFTDAPLVMKAFLGGQLNDDGIQVKWVAPTDLYFDVGMELARGRAFPAASGGGRNGFGSGSLFGHLGGDIGSSLAWQTGLSYLGASPQNRTYADFDSTGTQVTNSFSGDSRLWVADGVLKWSPNGNSTYNNFKLQGEYFRRTENGGLTYNADPASAPGAAAGTMNSSYASRQSGWYLQGVYQFLPMWRAGYRYDELNAGSTSIGLVGTGALSAADFPILGGYNPKRNTWMVDWSPSEFSRIRLQFARDYSRAGVTDNQIFLQYIVSMGAHGAHQF